MTARSWSPAARAPAASASSIDAIVSTPVSARSSGSRPVVYSCTRPARIDFTCISVCHSSMSANCFASERREERIGAERAQALLRVAELERAEALRARRSDDQRAARLEDVERRHHALDRLVVGLVERMPGRRRDDRLEAAADRHADALSDDERDRLEVARDHLAEIDVDEVAVVVDHGVDRVDLAQHAHDLELLLVQRIAGEVALDRERVLHEARAVERADRVLVRDARRDDLAAARTSPP